jgi:hypothetical protein
VILNSASKLDKNEIMVGACLKLGPVSFSARQLGTLLEIQLKLGIFVFNEK